MDAGFYGLVPGVYGLFLDLVTYGLVPGTDDLGGGEGYGQLLEWVTFLLTSGLVLKWSSYLPLSLSNPPPPIRRSKLVSRDGLFKQQMTQHMGVVA